MSRPSRLFAAAAAFGCAFAAGNVVAAAACPNAGWVVVEAKASGETHVVTVGLEGKLFVRRTLITTTTDLTEIKLTGDAYDTQLQMKFTPEAARRLHDATTNKDGLHIAFVVDDSALGAVTWTGPYGMDADLGVQISLGKFTPELQPLVQAIERCIRPNSK